MRDIKQLRKRFFSDRPALQVFEILSPLNRSHFSLKTGQSALIVLINGTCNPDKAQNTEEQNLCWFPQSRTGESRTFNLSAGSQGFVLLLSTEQLIHTFPDGVPGEDLRYLLTQPILLEAKQVATVLTSYLNTMKLELQVPGPASPQILSHLLSLCFLEIWRHLQTINLAGQVVPGSIAEKFMGLLRIHMTEHWSVEQYARKTGVNRDRLGSALRKATGHSPKYLIQQALNSKAKEMLENSGLNVSEIAFRLGFEDAGYFNRYFTRLNQISPGRYRREKRLMTTPEDDQSFAAWP